MEKIYIKTAAKEIIAKGSTEDGHSDIFSYDPEPNEHSRKLGNLYVVGHVQHATSDVAYMVNLVAALAKREYYAKPHAQAKEAFTNTLKKINEVVEDFFKNEGLKINVGVFAIANDQIFISKLGKFKILLARDGRSIDILNNVDLFEKELIQEKEFSNIISGKLMAHDRVLAFYPGQPLTSKERVIKSAFMKMKEDEFENKINALKKQHSSFSCALLYLNLSTVRETTKTPRLEPQELVEANLASQESKMLKLKDKKAAKEAKMGQEQVETPVTANLAKPLAQPAKMMNTEVEVPRIIPSEFSLGKRNMFDSLVKRLRFINIINLSFNWRNKTFLYLCGVALIIVMTLVTKTVLNLDPDLRKFKSAVSSAETNMRLAQTKITQDDALQARQLLLSSISNIHSYYSYDSHKTESVEKKLYALLDTIDQVREVSPTLVYQLDKEFDQASLLAVNNNTLFVYAPNKKYDPKSSQYSSGNLIQIEDEAVKNKWETKTLVPTSLFDNGGSPLLVDTVNHTVAVLKDNKLKGLDVTLPTPLLDFDFYQDNLYLLSDSLYKIPNVTKNATKLGRWLDAKTALNTDPLLMTVDGDVFVLSKSGLLTAYYKGSKKSEVKTALAPNEQSILLTNQDSEFLYLIDKLIGRIYILDKTAGVTKKTYKLEAPNIIAVALASDDTVFFLTKDNKIWKLK